MAEDDTYELQFRVGSTISRITNRKSYAEIDANNELIVTLGDMLELLDHIEFLAGKIAELENTIDRED